LGKLEPGEGMGTGELGELEPRREGNGNSAIGEC